MDDALCDAIQDAGLDAVMKTLLDECKADAIADSLWVLSCGGDTERLKRWVIRLLEEEMGIK